MATNDDISIDIWAEGDVLQHQLERCERMVLKVLGELIWRRRCRRERLGFIACFVGVAFIIAMMFV